MNETPIIPEPLARNLEGQPLETRLRFRRVNEITGTFVLVIVAMLIAGVVWTERSQRWFRSNVRLRISLPETGAAGIQQGSEVYFLGTHVGSVSDVNVVDSAGHMEAEATIRRDYFQFVRADSSAVVKKKFGVAGDSFFEITRGNGNPLPEEDAKIVCNEQFQSALESAIEEIRRETLLVLKKTTTGLETWTQLGAGLGETRQHLDQLTARIENLAAGVESGKGTVGKLLTDDALADAAKNLLSRANQAMGEFQGVVTNLNIASKNIQNSTTRMPEITGAVADEMKDVSGLVQQTQTSMRELERLIEAMQQHWIVRKYVNHSTPPASNELSKTAAPGKQSTLLH